MQRQMNWGKVSLFALIATGALGAGGYATYKYFSNRPGEAAIRFVPSDADVVITLDLKPSERQMDTFQKIGDALEAQGITGKADDWLKGMFVKEPWAERIRENLDRSFALAMWTPDGDQSTQPQTAMFMGVKSPSEVEAQLEKFHTPEADGTVHIDGGMVALVIDNYLVVASSGLEIPKIKATLNGSSQSMASVEAFQEARSALPPDANLMVFVSPHALAEASKGMKQQMGLNPLRGSKWLSFGATLIADGLQLDIQSPLDADGAKFLQPLSKAQPINEGAMKLLPHGALGFCAMSQPGLSVHTMYATALDGDANVQKSLNEFQKETGLSVENDIEPGLMGDVVVAVYPSADTKVRPVEAIMALTTANGATPKSLATKVREAIVRKSTESGDHSLQVSSEAIDGGTLWTFGAQKSGDQSIQPCYAETEKGVFVALSPEFLKSALASRNGAQTLADEQAFTPAATAFVPGAQVGYAVDVRKTLETMRSQIEPSLSNGPLNWDDIIALTTGATLTGSARFDGKTFVGKGMLPVNFEGVVKLIGKMMRENERPRNSSESLEFK